MEVVPVVVDVEEPVLERDLSRVGDDVRVDGRLASLGDAAAPALVVAAGVERVAGKVEVVLVAAREVAPNRGDLHEVGGPPWPAEGHALLAQDGVDVGRLVRLARPALLLLLDEAYDGRVALGQCLLVGEVGRRARREDEDG